MAGTQCTLDIAQDATYNIIIKKDRSLNQKFQAYFTSGSTEYDFDFTAYSGATLDVKRNFNSADTIITFSTDDGSIILGLNGEFSLIKSAALLENIRANNYIYDMYLSSITVPKRAFLSGKFTIKDRVTN